jgi:valyl-tRNA synthetase
MQNKYFILTPPPNLTGDVHSGHTLNLIIQDIIIKYLNLLHNITVESILGFDHAALYAEIIAKKESTNNSNIIQIIQNNSNKYKVRILQKLKSYGFTYNNKDEELFTYSEYAKIIVNKSLQQLLYNKLCNLYSKICYVDTVDNTTLSDLELMQNKCNKKLYIIRYYLVDSFGHETDKYVCVATTRPETIEADIFLCFNPDDNRYTKYINMNILNPISNKMMFFKTSSKITKSFGTGLVKITPTFSITDEAICKELNVKYSHEDIIYDCKTLKFNNKSKFYNHLIYKANDKAIEYLSNLDKKYIENIQQHNTVEYMSRRNSNKVTTILTKQYFINLQQIVDQSKYNLKDINLIGCKGHLDINQFTNNLKLWCISRQNIYGHKIDEDNSLDTWFSSSLYPVIAIDTLKLKLSENIKFIIITAYDIMFFWIYKMFYMSQYYLDKQLIHSVIIHGLICDQHGNKISKSKNNDTMHIMDQNNILLHEKHKLYLILHNPFNKKIILDSSKMEAPDKFFKKIKNIIEFIHKNNFQYEYTMDFKQYSSDVILQYMIDKMKYIFSLNFTQDIDIIINNIANIISSFGRIVNFTKLEISNTILINLCNNDLLQNRLYQDFTNTLIILVMQYSAILVPNTIQQLVDVTTFKHYSNNLLYLFAQQKILIKYEVIKMLDMLIKILNSPNYIKDYSSYVTISNTKIFLVVNNYEDYDKKIIIYNDNYIFFNTKLIEQCNYQCIKNLYRYASKI